LAATVINVFIQHLTAVSAIPMHHHLHKTRLQNYTNVIMQRSTSSQNLFKISSLPNHREI